MQDRKVSPGERGQLPASWYNRTTDLVETVRRMRAGGGIDFPRSQTVVKVRNDTGDDLDRRSVVRLSSAFIGPADNLIEWQGKPNLKAVAPDGTAKDHSFGVLAEPIRDGGIGRAIVSGVAPARVVRTQLGHHFARPVAGSTGALVSDQNYGARLLAPAPWAGSTGTEDGYVLLPYQCCCCDISPTVYLDPSYNPDIGACDWAAFYLDKGDGTYLIESPPGVSQFFIVHEWASPLTPERVYHFHDWDFGPWPAGTDFAIYDGLSADGCSCWTGGAISECYQGERDEDFYYCQPGSWTDPPLNPLQQTMWFKVRVDPFVGDSGYVTLSRGDCPTP